MEKVTPTLYVDTTHFCTHAKLVSTRDHSKGGLCERRLATDPNLLQSSSSRDRQASARSSFPNPTRRVHTSTHTHDPARLLCIKSSHPPLHQNHHESRSRPRSLGCALRRHGSARGAYRGWQPQPVRASTEPVVGRLRGQAVGWQRCCTRRRRWLGSQVYAVPSRRRQVGHRRLWFWRKQQQALGRQRRRRLQASSRGQACVWQLRFWRQDPWQRSCQDAVPTG
jgi:hypothetical protein